MNWKKFVNKNRLLDFPVLQMLSSLLKNNIGNLVINSKPSEGVEGPTDKLMTIGGSASDYTIDIVADNSNVLNNLTSAMTRSGLIEPYDLDKVASKLASNKDLILGLDTNLLYNCIISEHLLNALDEMNPYSYSKIPKWILFAVPGVVMKEIENAANHKSKGRLTHIGRIGFRALQEIHTLQENKGNSGYTVLVVGKTNPPQLRYIGEDSTKLQNADSLIRDQFRTFVQEIDLRKGVYFLTMDKTNSSLGEAEGLNAIRVKHPKMLKTGYQLRQVSGKTVLLGRIIYELAVEFGIIEITWKEHGRFHYLELDSGWQWKNMGHWENWQLLCSDFDHNFYREIDSYEDIPVQRIRDQWNEFRGSMD
ncbi:MAG: PIN domain-containing protein [Candidatus Saliniplasma sp.]